VVYLDGEEEWGVGHHGHPESIRERTLHANCGLQVYLTCYAPENPESHMLLRLAHRAVQGNHRHGGTEEAFRPTRVLRRLAFTFLEVVPGTVDFTENYERDLYLVPYYLNI